MKAALQRFGLRSLLARWHAAPKQRALPVRSGLERVTPSPTRIAGFDQALALLVVALLAFGLVMVYSASVALPDSPRGARVSELYFLARHSTAIAIGIVAALVALQVPIAVWEKWAPWLFVGALLLLALVLVPYVGAMKNGARRWISLGVLNFQPSEAAKLVMTMYAASYMVRKMDVKEHFFKAVWPMAVALAVIGLLLLAEPDMGAFVVIAAIAVGILFLGGVNGRMFVLICTVLAAAFVAMIAFSDWRAERIWAWLDPWNEKYSRGRAYQLTHSLIAFGRGGIFGEGLGGSVEKLNYLPEAHTDFLLAVVGEELGFVAVAIIIAAFFWMTRRIFVIGRQAIALDRVF
ncbi:MAG TPA: FtsW/RodA/SpoVE family cell cycle protein, partial [Burkholderiaceae bacterium]|nr:FtsW/RodA/SpoVE family cell cycle protein [Burkholderiaceae bacterium]